MKRSLHWLGAVFLVGPLLIGGCAQQGGEETQPNVPQTKMGKALEGPPEEPANQPMAFTDSDNYWDSRFAPMGFASGTSIRSIFVNGDDIYFGGTFTAVEGITVNRIVRYKKSTKQWIPLVSSAPGAVPGLDAGQVNAIAVVGNYLYVGFASSNVGVYDATGRITANYMARFDLTANVWARMPVQPNYQVDALLPTADGTKLYIGGNFSNLSGTSRIVMYDPEAATYSSVGTGTNQQVYALALDSSGNLYAGGNISSIGGVTTYKIAMWNGTAWSAMGAGLGTAGTVRAILPHGTDVYVGGVGLGTSGTLVFNRIVRWDTTTSTWNVMNNVSSTPGLNLDVYALAWYNDALHLGGFFSTTAASGGPTLNYFAKYNAAIDRFEKPSLKSGLETSVYALAVDGSMLIAGGSFTTTKQTAMSATVADTQLNYAAKWDGSEWMPFSSTQGLPATSAYVNGIASLGTGIVAGGSFNTAGPRRVDRVALWNGAAWNTIGTSTSSATINAIATAPTGNAVIIGGSFSTIAGWPANNIVMWDGTDFVDMGTGLNGTVYSLLVNGTDVYATGTFTDEGVAASKTLNHVARWDGTTWHALGAGISTSSWMDIVYASAWMDGKLYIGGSFTAPGASVAVWDGTAWSGVGTGLNHDVRALLAWNGTLYAGGRFTDVAGGTTTSIKGIATWNGTSWTEFNGGITSTATATVRAFAVYGNDLYVGGKFNTVGAVNATNIAAWRSDGWHALGSGMDSAGEVDALLVAGDYLYAGGTFNMAGNKPSSKFGIYSLNPPLPPTVTDPVGTTICSGSTATLNVVASGTGPFTYLWEESVNGTSWSPATGGTGSPTYTTPSLTSAMQYRCKVTNGGGTVTSAAATVSVTSISISPATLPGGNVNQAYSQTITAAGGNTPYTFAVTAGTLPAGLTLSAGGLLSGTPTQGESKTFTITATDATPCSTSLEYTVVIVSLKANGENCNEGSECVSTHCVDGVCCNNACTGNCEACDVATAAGTCTGFTGDPVTFDRPACLGTGVCAGSCQAASPTACTYPSGNECSAQSCTDNTYTPAGACSAGACVVGPDTTCANFLMCGPAGACLTTCSGDSDCVSTHYCNAGACTLKLSAGAQCTANNQCNSTFCTDGVCCNSPCMGICEACNATGTCAPVTGAPVGSRPACPGSGLCGASCNGVETLTCTYPGATTQCSDPSCSGSLYTGAGSCNAAGDCTIPAAMSCANGYMCGTNACLLACNTSTECQAPGYYCNSNVCVPTFAKGQACTKDEECATAHCVDLVCCDGPCTGQCEACNVTDHVGDCWAVTGAPVTPRNECAGGGTACVGTCDGQERTKCTYPGASTECRAASCANDIAVLAEGCDGEGACPAERTQACTPFHCNDTATACRGDCRDDTDCTDPNDFCSSGVCIDKLINGAQCAGANECVSNFCVDGVCCDSACNGQCEACAEAATSGQCVPVTEAPRGSRTPCDTDGTVCGGKCDGTVRDRCDYPSTNLICRDGSCVDGVAVVTAFCNGAGRCPPLSEQVCAPYECGQGQCLGDCITDDECEDGNFCNAGICVAKLALGNVCTRDFACVSGKCVDERCCSSDCLGQCEACDVDNTGECKPVTGAPHGSRTVCDSDNSACGGQCDGTNRAACAYPGQTTECRAASCTNDVATVQAFCNGTGTCPAVDTVQCEPYHCANDVCAVDCTLDTDCSGDRYCKAGTCTLKVAQGEACTANRECLNNTCVDGFCCSSACDGQCEACDIADHLGECTMVASGAPHGSRTPCNGTGTCQGACNGSSATACVYPGTDVVCATATCQDNVLMLEAACNGAGACEEQETENCAPGTCQGAACVDPPDAGIVVEDGGVQTPDAAVVTDASVPPADAAVTVDSGTQPDAAVVADGGVRPDGAVVADAGPRPDGAVVADAGGKTDGSVVGDAGPRPDGAVTNPDAGGTKTDAAVVEPEPGDDDDDDDDSCGCESSQSNRVPTLISLIIVVGLLARKRRTR